MLQSSHRRCSGAVHQQWCRLGPALHSVAGGQHLSGGAGASIPARRSFKGQLCSCTLHTAHSSTIELTCDSSGDSFLASRIARPELFSGNDRGSLDGSKREPTPWISFDVVQIMSASHVTMHRGQQAAALAAAFGAQALPSVVYIPPNCADRTTAQCRLDPLVH